MPSYTTSATTKGGRNGRALLQDHGLSLAMGLQKEVGGNGEGHNPEQLLALGWASCFGSAILGLAKKHGLDGQAAKVTCAITIDKDATSFALKSDIKLTIPGADKDKLEALIKDAHEICPYSKATRGNIPVTLSVA